ncbi:MAG: hypothetical protein Ta2A_09110 [Treponemataceae bacterium]|nr:MAG: hypothetical protein Ta2A_09110 [Treponemataceae bacterium]
MKRMIMVFTFASLALFGNVVAQDSASDEVPATTSVPRIEVLQEKLDGKPPMASITIEYTAVTDEARFVYTCPSALFDRGEAMNRIKQRATTFTRERKYYFYTYTRPDSTKFDNENKMAVYTSYVKFLH